LVIVHRHSTGPTTRRTATTQAPPDLLFWTSRSCSFTTDKPTNSINNDTHTATNSNIIQMGTFIRNETALTQLPSQVSDCGGRLLKLTERSHTINTSLYRVDDGAIIPLAKLASTNGSAGVVPVDHQSANVPLSRWLQPLVCHPQNQLVIASEDGTLIEYNLHDVFNEHGVRINEATTTNIPNSMHRRPLHAIGRTCTSLIVPHRLLRPSCLDHLREAPTYYSLGRHSCNGIDSGSIKDSLVPHYYIFTQSSTTRSICYIIDGNTPNGTVVFQRANIKRIIIADTYDRDRFILMTQNGTAQLWTLQRALTSFIPSASSPIQASYEWSIKDMIDIVWLSPHHVGMANAKHSISVFDISSLIASSSTSCTIPTEPVLVARWLNGYDIKSLVSRSLPRDYTKAATEWLFHSLSLSVVMSHDIIAIMAGYYFGASIGS
jgi:hypothetical protein